MARHQLCIISIIILPNYYYEFHRIKYSSESPPSSLNGFGHDPLPRQRTKNKEQKKNQ